MSLAREVTELRAIVDVMKGALAAEGLGEELQHCRRWMIGLARQERALVGALIAASPRMVSYEGLLQVLPAQDHTRERELNLVKVIACRARQRVGSRAIQTIKGVGYFMPTAERDRLLSEGRT